MNHRVSIKTFHGTIFKIYFLVENVSTILRENFEHDYSAMSNIIYAGNRAILYAEF